MLIARVFSLYIHLCSKWLIIHLGQGKDVSDHIRSKYTLLRDVEDSQVGLYDKPLPCFGCGIGWFSWVLWNFVVYKHFRECLSLLTSCFEFPNLHFVSLSVLQFPSWVFFPTTVVLCHDSLLLECPQRSKGTSWISCICHCCKCFSQFHSIIKRWKEKKQA